MNEFKGYSLFNDIEDVDLRDRNRAVVLSNMVDQNTRNNKTTPRAAALVIGYFKCIPEGERTKVYELFKKRLGELGYVS